MRHHILNYSAMIGIVIKCYIRTYITVTNKVNVCNYSIHGWSGSFHDLPNRSKIVPAIALVAGSCVACPQARPCSAQLPPTLFPTKTSTEAIASCSCTMSFTVCTSKFEASGRRKESRFFAKLAVQTQRKTLTKKETYLLYYRS